MAPVELQDPIHALGHSTDDESLNPILLGDRQQLFVKYFRSGRTRHIRGTGLGLAVTRDIVRAHGGDLEVESREGTGATFSFALRCAPQPAGTLPPAAASHA